MKIGTSIAIASIWISVALIAAFAGSEACTFTAIPAMFATVIIALASN